SRSGTPELALRRRRSVGYPASKYFCGTTLSFRDVIACSTRAADGRETHSAFGSSSTKSPGPHLCSSLTAKRNDTLGNGVPTSNTSFEHRADTNEHDPQPPSMVI